MNQNNYIYTQYPNWATSHEYFVENPSDESPRCEVQPSRRESGFLIATISTPEGHFPPFLDAELDFNIDFAQQRLSNDENFYLSSDKKILVIACPDLREPFLIEAKGEKIPYCLTVTHFHPDSSLIQSQIKSSPPVPFRCKACKSTAKALALAIVAAAALPAIPSALITSVATFLGWGAVPAAAFIASVIGDTADAIAEKLCKKVGLC